LKEQRAMNKPKTDRASIRLHLWLEREGSTLFGMGRAQLLLHVDRLGSINRAAKHMGMGYRAAWGKLQQSEHTLGIKLLEGRGAKCEGVRLTPEAQKLVAAFQAWFQVVEAAALKAAEELLPFPVTSFVQPAEQPVDLTPDLPAVAPPKEPCAKLRIC